MRIGFLISELSHQNGWATYSLSLIRALQEIGFEARVITARNSPRLPNIESHALLPTVAPPDKNSLLRMTALTPRVSHLLSDCDIVHSTVEHYAPLALTIVGNRPLFVTGHGSYVNLPNIRRFPVGALYKKAFLRSVMVCVSRYTARVAVEVLPELKTVIVNNGVNVERFADPPPLEIPKRGPTILTTGGVKKRKGTLELVRAVAEVRDHIPDVQCVVIGRIHKNPYTEQVQSEIARLDLHNHVQLLGFVSEEEVLAWYGAADVFVMPSINSEWQFEGFGLVHMEASAAGIPVIGSTNCGAEDAIDDGVTGLLVNQANIEEELPDAILTILGDPERAAEMGAAGFQKAQEQSWASVADKMQWLYMLEAERYT